MEIIELANGNESLGCPHCSGPIESTDRFCGHCGKEIKLVEATQNKDIFSVLNPTLVYYFVTLILLATYKLTNAFPEGFRGLTIISVLDVSIVIVFSIYFFKDIKPLLSLSNLNISVLFLTIVGAVIGSVVVTFVASAIEVSIQDDTFYNTYLFEDTNYPIFWAILFICVQPAIFEEVAFRGFLFSNLQKVATPKSAIYITGFLFGILHLSFISLLWLVPIGLVFAFLRMKYNTLWYGIIGHFTYNFSITAIEFLF